MFNPATPLEGFSTQDPTRNVAAQMASAEQAPYYQIPTSSNPAITQTNGNELYEIDEPKEQGQLVDSPWKEPRVKSPTPSYLDMKGGERQGVVANMMPLGVFPSNKYKMKARATGSFQRTMHGRSYLGEEGSDTPYSANISEDLRVASPVTLEQSKQTSPTAEARAGPTHQGISLTPAGQVKAAPPPSLCSQPSITQQSPTTRQMYESPNMQFTPSFDKAMAEANRRGDFDLGKAISHLRSQLHQHGDIIADQLTAVSRIDPSQEQAKTFRKTVGRIKKQFRAQHSMSRFVNGTIGVVDPLLSTKSYSAQTSPMRPKTNRGASAPQHDPPSQPQHLSSQTSQRPSSTKPTPSIKLKFRNTFSPSPAVHNNHHSIPYTTPSHSSELPAGPDQEMASTSRRKASKPEARDPAQRKQNSNGESNSSSPLSEFNEDVVNKPPDSLEPTESPPPGPSTRKRKHDEVRGGSPPPYPTLKDAAIPTMDVPPNYEPTESDNERYSKKQRMLKTFPDYHVQDSNEREQDPRRKHLANPASGWPGAPQKPTRDHSTPMDVDVLTGAKRPAPESSSFKSANDLWQIPDKEAAVERGLLSPTQGVTGPTNLGRPPKRQKVFKSSKSHYVGGKRNPPAAETCAIFGGVPPRRSARNRAKEDTESLNRDVCQSCGGHGLFLTCDGCERGFHMRCLGLFPKDMDRMKSTWLCNICKAERQPVEQKQGAWGPLLMQLERSNPAAFMLPDEVRDFFDGAKTNEFGEYVENTRKIAMPRGMDAKDPNHDFLFHKRLFDPKGKAIFCVHCKQSSQGRRDLIQCDFCHAYWHTDCLDYPRANAHLYTSERNMREEWMCPMHFEQDLKHLDPLVGDVNESRLRRSHRVRKPKDPITISVDRLPAPKPGSSNRMRNAMIEVELSESEDEPEFEESSDEEKITVNRVPSKSIKLDFISQVKVKRFRDFQKTREEAAMLELREAKKRYNNAELLGEERNLRVEQARLERDNQAKFEERLKKYNFFDLRDASLLTDFAAQKHPKFGFDSQNNIAVLIESLIQEAPTEVLEHFKEEPQNDEYQPDSAPTGLAPTESSASNKAKRLANLRKLSLLIESYIDTEESNAAVDAAVQK